MQPTNVLGEVTQEQMALMIPILAIGGGFVVAIVAIIAKAVQGSVVSRHREESRREVAAYVAEGTMSPDDAQKILNAGDPKWRKLGL